MKERNLTDPILFTNVLFFINAFAYFTKSYYICGTLMLGCALFSTLHHWKYEEHKLFHTLDVCFAYSTLLITLYYVLPYSNFGDTSLLIFVLSIALIFRHMANTIDYSIHVFWHITVFIGQILIWSILP